MSNGQNNVIIKNFGLANFRSFGPDLQMFGPFENVNLFIGPNNSGKSNVLRFIADFLSNACKAIVHDSPFAFDTDDRYLRTNENLLYLKFTTEFDVSNFRRRFSGYLSNSDYSTPIAQYFLERAEGQLLTYTFKSIGEPGATSFSNESLDFFTEVVREITNSMPSNTVGYDANTRIVGNMLATYYDIALPQLLNLPRIPLIPALRQITLNQQTGAYDGAGLIKVIASWINHRGKDRERKAKKDSLLSFVREVSGYPDAALTVVEGDTALEINTDGEAYPLEHVATGLHELVLLAAYCLALENSVICLEEPESHLHPTWQRALVQYLQKKTSNQYFISTHSAHIIDIPEVAVFSMFRDKGQTKVRQGIGEKTLVKSLRDLGYRASDLFQANYILWVEGPSDRLYILHWLKVAAPELIEGIHFSIMFYSGSLLKHLSVTLNQQEVEEDSEEKADSELDISDSVPEPILLRRLNQNFGLVMDSDKKSEAAPVGVKWKRINRIKNQLESDNLFAWITDGRTTENYTNGEIMTRAAELLHPDYKYITPKSVFDNAFEYFNSSGKPDYDKVKLAEKYTLLIELDSQNEIRNPEKSSFEVFACSKMGKDLVAHITRLKQAISDSQVN